MFIVLEGLDGAGKSTQMKYLQDFFQSRQQKSQCIHFPRFDAPLFGPLIAQFLRGDLGGIEQVSPSLVALLFAGDRHDAAPQIKEWLMQGYAVIADRYVYSNIAYQCAKLADQGKQKELRDWILQMEYGYFNLPRPDLNLFLDVPLTFVAQKLHAPRDGDDRAYLDGRSDIHESSIILQEKVRQVYVEQTCLDADFELVLCKGSDGSMLPAPDIFSLIKDKLLAFIAEGGFLDAMGGHTGPPQQ
ncbi:MAG: dTMP kinase [Bacteroidales bacterium]|nr:dTMP kinase [Bacteroidales bacterium]